MSATQTFRHRTAVAALAALDCAATARRMSRDAVAVTSEVSTATPQMTAADDAIKEVFTKLLDFQSYQVDRPGG